MKRNKTYDHDIVALLVFTLFTLSTWVGFEIYHAYTKPNVPEALARHLREIKPGLNTNVLSALSTRLP